LSVILLNLHHDDDDDDDDYRLLYFLVQVRCPSAQESMTHTQETLLCK